MKVLLDHNVTHKLCRSLTGHAVMTGDEMGWAWETVHCSGPPKAKVLR